MSFLKRVTLASRVLGMTFLGGLVAAACGSEEESVFATDAGSDGGDDDGGGFLDGGFVDATSDTGLNACATDKNEANLLPLDMYLMVDTSESMDQPVTPTASRWQAVRKAIVDFSKDPRSKGVSVALQFFPIIKDPTKPTNCTDDASCNGAGPCINNKGCTAATRFKLCKQKSDCADVGGGECEVVGQCANAPSYCFGGSCSGSGGACNLGAFAYCTGRDSCLASDYATPAVPMGELPAHATAIESKINSRDSNGTKPQDGTDGLTPTQGALTGAISFAKTHAGKTPDHVTVAVLATDGFPTECAVQDIPGIKAIAASGLTGPQPIKTFVIGVFSPGEQTTATSNLNEIASGGGGSAFIINTSEDVTLGFLKALATIRGASLPCDFKLPTPEAGIPDYTKVNVQFSHSNGQAEVFPYVQASRNCSGTTGGWYYDVDPAAAGGDGGRPTKVILCPKSCTTVKDDPLGKIEIVQGCKTIVPIR